MKKLKLLLIVFVVLLLPATGCYAAGPWKGKVIDAETKQPIEGAAVVAVWDKEWAGLGAGADTQFLDAEETVTDKNGDFVIPAKSFLSVPYFRKVKGPFFTIFKPAYGSFPNFQKSPLVIPDDYFLSKRGIVELPKLKTGEERRRSLLIGQVSTEVPRKKIPNYYRLINEENRNIGIPEYPEVGK